MTLINFNPFFYDKILEKEIISRYFVNYAKKHAIDKKNLWSIPINHQDIKHWSLLLVIVNQRTIIYLDSLHNDPSQLVVNAICEYIAIVLKESWNDWKLYSPKDIPYQGGSGYCGVHIISWALHIATTCDHPFDESDMNDARRGIAAMLYRAKNNIITERRNVQGEKWLSKCEENQTVMNNKGDISVIKSHYYLDIHEDIPCGFNSTLEFCKILPQLEDNARGPLTHRK